MGILDSSTLTVDAILTKQGRQRLALGTLISLNSPLVMKKLIIIYMM